MRVMSGGRFGEVGDPPSFLFLSRRRVGKMPPGHFGRWISGGGGASIPAIWWTSPPKGAAATGVLGMVKGTRMPGRVMWGPEGS